MTIPRTLGASVALAACAASLCAQPSPFAWRRAHLAGGQVVEFRARFPQGHDPREPLPFFVVLAGGGQDRAAVYDELAGFWWRELDRERFGVLLPVAPRPARFAEDAPRWLPELLQRLRTGITIRGNRLHLVGVAEGAHAALALAARVPYEFATLVTVGAKDWTEAERARLEALRSRGVRVHELPESARKDGRFDALRAELLAAGEPAAGPEREIARTLDRWHAAAARADAELYFGTLTEDAVFLGTDPDERWTRAEFEAFARRYFERPPAWIYVPIERHVGLSPGGETAWVDERLAHARYGDCRGSATLWRVDGRWRIAHYDLTVPVPNALMEGVVAEIRRLRAGGSAALAPRTVVLVRHAEKAAEGGEDPPLTPAGRARAQVLARMLAAARPAALFCTELRRTRETLAPLARATGREPRVVAAGDPAELAARLRALPGGALAVVAGHSNTIPALLRALGIADPPAIEEDDYDRLLLVTLDAANRATLQRLRFGPVPVPR